MHVAELWRYPVKSMAGETLREGEIRVGGLTGDRIVHAENGRGRVLTARTHPPTGGYVRTSSSAASTGSPSVAGQGGASGSDGRSSRSRSCGDVA